MVVTCQMTVILPFFWKIGGVVGPHESQMKNWGFCSYGISGDKITVFTCLLSSERCDSFPTHLDLALAPNKTNEAVNRITVITPLDCSPISSLRELKLTKLAVLLNALAQRSTSWCHQPRPCDRTPRTKPRGVLCLLIGVVANV